jgi:hypothetical protein
MRTRYGLGAAPDGNGGSGYERDAPGPVTDLGKWFDEVFVALLVIFNTAYDAWLNPDERSHVKVVALHEAMNKLVEAYAKLYSGIIKYNPVTTNEILAEMGLPVAEENPKTPSPVPDTIPEVRWEFPAPASVKIIYKYIHSPRGGKPKTYHGVEIRYAILDHAPEVWNDLNHSEFSTKSPHILAFDISARGKVLYFALRWENKVGGKGQWSEIFNVIIP